MADHMIYLQTQPLMPIGNSTVNQHTNVHESNIKSSEKNQFALLLAKETDKLTFSQHAIERLRSRDLQLSDQDLTKINDAVKRAAQKGAKESLVYCNDIALVVSVQNKTVITAMDGNSARNTIFTNIDSAVII
ncbi:TIGR02530 family flagellar biosynthesis protein [Propionispira raffinosivorans]|uniref:TIGR02530 family flagellar biosynthesis protein n=1 Tax=Propionispira raffinosivorans TaxID=86959 RepID=UPI0003730DC2|nr:TIGR02530 family flagellar biosynthesis protein [Propionispira raffinosivorans]